MESSGLRKRPQSDWSRWRARRVTTPAVIGVTIPSALGAKINALRTKLQETETRIREGELADRLRALARELTGAAKDLEQIRQITKLLMAEELGLPDAG